MYVVVASSKDPASLNIQRNLLEEANWEEGGVFKGSPVHRTGALILVTNDEHHIYAEELDREIKEKLEVVPDGMIFASRHKAASGVVSLTVHPIGNFAAAEFGGWERTLVPSMPHEMTHAFLRLLVHGRDLDRQITFEATHHGPHLETPTLFIEIGSDEEQWEDGEAGRVVAKTILDIPDHTPSERVLVGVGGGHYCPRHTDVVREYDVSYGHIIPGWALGDASDSSVLSAVERTPGAEEVYFHRKAMRGRDRRRLERVFADNGYRVVQSGDLKER